MPPAVSRQTFQQAMSLFSIVGKRTAFAAGIGALFCFTEATVEQMRGGEDMTGGMIAGAVAGLAYGGFRPLPQPIVWPLTFALASASADICTRVIPKNMAGFRWGRVRNSRDLSVGHHFIILVLPPQPPSLLQDVRAGPGPRELGRPRSPPATDHGHFCGCEAFARRPLLEGQLSFRMRRFAF